MQNTDVFPEAPTMTAALPIPLAPGRLPILGHSLSLFKRPLEFLCSLEAIGSVVQVDIGKHSSVIVTSPELTMQVLQDGQTFDKGGIFFDKVHELTGESLLTAKFTAHKRQRRMVQPAFTRTRVEEYSSVMREVIDSVLGEWQNGSVVDITAVMYDITSRVAARTMFAAEVAGASSARVVEALAIYLNGLFARMWAPRWTRNLLPLPSNARYNDALKVLHGTVDEIIASYKASGIDHGDLLSMLLAVGDNQDGPPLTPEEVHNQVITLFLAGVETTASALSWSLYLLGNHPQIAEDLNAEVDTVLNGRTPAWDDLRKLSVTGRVVSEALRLYPPTWIFTRVTTKDTILGQHVLPKGTGVAYSPYLLHRSPTNFERPEHFDPDRWLPERAANVRRGAFVPFGSGSHRCIGESFAMTEIMLALAAIASKWTFQPTINRPVTPAPYRATLTPGQLPMRVRRRNTFVK